MATAKKTPAKKAPVKKQTPVQETVVAEAPAVNIGEETHKTPPMPAKPKWEYRDRLYEITKNKKPIVYSIPSRHSAKVPLLWFDEEKGYQRELRYATNQKSCFVDEQEGPVTLGRIVFRDGVLDVPKQNVALQQLLSLYHPYMADGRIAEYNPTAIAEKEVAGIEDALEAMNVAANMDIDQAEAIMRTELGSEVSKMSSKELKRDLLVFANSNPYLFLQLANDENVHLRNVGIRATEMGIIKLSSDNRTFSYGNTGRKLMTVPFDEHPYSALAAYFKTDEGMEVLGAIEKRL
jgi:hypothetical protein